MAGKETEKQDGASLFGRIVDAIARRSALIKQQEADYTALVLEKDTAVSDAKSYVLGMHEAQDARDKAQTSRDAAIASRDKAVASLASFEERANLAEAQLAQIAQELGIDLNPSPEVVEDVAEPDPPVAEHPAQETAATGKPEPAAKK